MVGTDELTSQQDDKAPEANAEPPRRTWSEKRRAADRRRRTAAPLRGSGSGDLLPEVVVGEAVANVVTLSGFLLPLAPHVAVTLAGVPDPQNREEWLVRSRAHMAGNVLLEHAKRDVRVLRAIDRFNRLFTNVEALEVIGSVVAAGAVDAHLVDAHATIRLPGGIEAPVLAPVIGDVISYVDSEREAAERGINVPADPAAVSRTMAANRGPVTVDGGVEAT